MTPSESELPSEQEPLLMCLGARRAPTGPRRRMRNKVTDRRQKDHTWLRPLSG